MVASEIFNDFVDFIARMSPKEIISFKPSENASQRYEFLVQKEKSEGLLTDEKKELDNYEVLEFIMRRAKAKARIILST